MADREDRAVADAVDRVVRDGRISDLERRIVDLEAALKKAQDALHNFEVSANRWRGGMMAVIALGGLITWLVNVGSGIVKVLR